MWIQVYESSLGVHLLRSSSLGLLHISVIIMYHLTTPGLDLHNLSFLVHIDMPSTLHLQYVLQYFLILYYSN